MLDGLDKTGKTVYAILIMGNRFAIEAKNEGIILIRWYGHSQRSAQTICELIIPFSATNMLIYLFSN